MKKEKATSTVAKSIFPNVIHEDKEFRRQRKVIYKAFFDTPKTILQVSRKLGIPATRILWQVSILEKEKLLEFWKSGLCPFAKDIKPYYRITKKKKLKR